MEDAEIRLLVLDILVSIIDRHDNRHKFSPVRLGHTDKLKTTVDLLKKNQTVILWNMSWLETFYFILVYLTYFCVCNHAIKYLKIYNFIYTYGSLFPLLNKK